MLPAFPASEQLLYTVCTYLMSYTVQADKDDLVTEIHSCKRQWVKVKLDSKSIRGGHLAEHSTDKSNHS